MNPVTQLSEWKKIRNFFAHFFLGHLDGVVFLVIWRTKIFTSLGSFIHAEVEYMRYLHPTATNQGGQLERYVKAWLQYHSFAVR